MAVRSEKLSSEAVMPAAETPAELFHALRGWELQAEVSASVRAARLDLVPAESRSTVSIRILYCGAAGDNAEEITCRNDRHVYTRLCSPFPCEPSADANWGLFRDGTGSLWMDHYLFVNLKDPALYRNGLRFTFEVPEILARKKPVLTLRINGETLHEEVLDRGGVFTRTLDLSRVSAGALAYLERVRRHQRLILEEIIRICRKEDLRCYLICGGLIGILRDGVPLPWDDDLDIAFFREDYEAFAKAAAGEWSGSSEFRWVGCTDYGGEVFYDLMTRIVYLGEPAGIDPFSRLPEGVRSDIRGYTVADVYILDSAPDSPARHRMRARKLQLLYALALGHRPSFNADAHGEYGRSARFLVKLLGRAGRRIPLGKLLGAWHRTAVKEQNRQRKTCFMSNGYYRCFSIRFDKDWFGSGRQVPAWGMDVTIPAEAERFLETMYGDYRSYPPMQARIPMHRGYI